MRGGAGAGESVTLEARVGSSVERLRVLMLDANGQPCAAEGAGRTTLSTSWSAHLGSHVDTHTLLEPCLHAYS